MGKDSGQVLQDSSFLNNQVSSPGSSQIQQQNIQNCLPQFCLPFLWSSLSWQNPLNLYPTPKQFSHLSGSLPTLSVLSILNTLAPTGLLCLSRLHPPYAIRIPVLSFKAAIRHNVFQSQSLGSHCLPCTDFYCSPTTLSYTQGQGHTLRGCVRVDPRRACLQSQALSTVLGTHTHSLAYRPIKASTYVEETQR